MIVHRISPVLLMIAVASPSYAAGDQSFGVWRNPQNSVHVRAESCGPDVCGVVVWANQKAIADAHKHSNKPLVGSTLFRDFSQARPGVWRGRVFVPDIGKTFSGTITAIDNNHLEARGCLIGPIGCKSQRWTRIS